MKRLLPLLLLSGCGEFRSGDFHRTVVNGPSCTNEVNYGTYVDYVTEFKDLVEQATTIRPTDRIRSITTDKQEGNVLGTCYLWYQQNGNIVDAKISIDTDLILSGKVVERIVVFHELGHCIMNDLHIEDETDLMYPYIALDITEDEANTRIEHYMVRLSEGE